LPRPGFVTRTGGSHGGGAEVTDEGRRFILTFRRLEETLGRISTAIAAEGLEHDQDLLFWGIGLKLSVRNALFCKVVKITRAPINVELKLEVSPGLMITTVVTNASVNELDLAPGRCASQWASSVMLAQKGAAPRASARNKIAGTVVRRTDDGADSEVTVDIGGGKTIGCHPRGSRRGRGRARRASPGNLQDHACHSRSRLREDCSSAAISTHHRGMP
jgi:molybdate transport system regulatory protein